MKKLKTLKIVNFILLVSFIILFVILYLREINLKNTWYIILISFFALSLYAKFLIFKSDNVLWFAICLSLLIVFMVFYNYKLVDYRYLPLLAVNQSFASLLLFLIYKNVLHLNLTIFFLLLGAPLFLFSFGVLRWWIVLLIECFAIAIAVVFINLIHKFYTG